jgi:hypothetical protein
MKDQPVEEDCDDLEIAPAVFGIEIPPLVSAGGCHVMPSIGVGGAGCVQWDRGHAGIIRITSADRK